MKILFVDDEQRILSGLRRLLRDMRGEWEMSFLCDAEEALDAIKREPYDVVVSDLRMPGIDGEALLAEVKRIRPESLRILLSGESDPGAISRSMGVTHRYLEKPFDLEVLKATIELARATARELIADEGITRGLAKIDRLPSIPAVYRQIAEELEAPETTVGRIGDLIEGDVGMSAKLLQVVNSAAFRFPVPIERAGRAVSLLGIDRVKQLVLAAGLFDNFEASIDPRRLDEMWRHSRETCTLAALFVESLPERADILDAASSAALMHEAGRLILISNFPRRYAAALERAGRNGTAPALAEVEEFGAEHGRIGAYVLSLWGLPRTIVEAVAFHSWPSRTASAENLPLAIVHAACLLAHDPESEALDMDYLTAHGMDAHLEGWRRIAAQPAEDVQ